MRETKIVSICQRLFGVRGIEIAIGLMQIKWVNHIDSVITLACLFGVAWITRSFGAFLILILFGLWNYWRGMTEADRQDATTKKESAITKTMIERVKQIPPGGAIRCICEREKVEFIVIEASDFDHIAHMAGMMAVDKGDIDAS
jgi:ABC-type nickel/cobalt efflux system permease component RcnA